jgi:hypothetical protein
VIGTADPSRRPTRTMAVLAAGALTLATGVPAASAQPALANPGAGTYHLIEAQTNRGTTVEVNTNWDWVLLTNSSRSAGEAFTFEPNGNGYTIKSPLYHWDGYDTWCAEIAGIKLTREGECNGVSRFYLTHSDAYGGTYRISDGITSKARPVVYRDNGGKDWLRLFGRQRTDYQVIAYFKLEPA